VGCSSGLINRGFSGSLRSRLSGIATCRGDSCRFPVLGEGCDVFQDGPSSQVNSLCFSSKGTVRMGGTHGSRDEDATGGEGSISGNSSFRFPNRCGDWNSSHSGGVGLSLDNVLDSGCLGSRGVVRLGVIKTIGGNSGDGSMGSGIGSSGRNDDKATGGDTRRGVLGNGGMSHGRGIRSSDEGAVCFFTTNRIGGVGILSGVGDLFHGAGIMGVASLCGGDGVSDCGNGMLTGSLVTMGGGLYCSIDKYCRRCDPQGTRGSGGVLTQDGSTSGGLG